VFSIFTLYFGYTVYLFYPMKMYLIALAKSWFRLNSGCKKLPN